MREDDGYDVGDDFVLILVKMVTVMIKMVIKLFGSKMVTQFAFYADTTMNFQN